MERLSPQSSPQLSFLLAQVDWLSWNPPPAHHWPSGVLFLHHILFLVKHLRKHLCLPLVSVFCFFVQGSISFLTPVPPLICDCVYVCTCMGADRQIAKQISKNHKIRSPGHVGLDLVIKLHQSSESRHSHLLFSVWIIGTKPR